VTSKKNPHIYKNTKQLDAVKYNHALSNSHRIPYTEEILSPLPEEELQQNINRLSKNATQHITSSVIFSYLKLFIKKRTGDVIQSGLILGSIFFTANIIQLLIGNTSGLVNIISKGVCFFSVLIVGLSILRTIIFTQLEKKECPFFYGFAPFLGLHVILNLFAIIAVGAVDYFYLYMKIDAIENQLSYFLLSITTISITTSLLLTRFSFVLPAMIYPSDDDNLQGLSLRIKPFLKTLLFSLFCAKFICLNMIVFSDILVAYFPDISIVPYLVILPKMVGFVFYHIFVYVLLGVSFKLYCKIKVTP
jgi:hypothetical protein